MKRLTLLLLASVALTFFVACGDDDNTTATVELEGTTWQSTGYVATGCDDPVDNENSPNLTCTATDCETLALNNGTVTITSTENGLTETITATYVISGNTVTVTVTEDAETVTFDINYTIVGDVLTLRFTFPLDGCDVVQTYKAAN